MSRTAGRLTGREPRTPRGPSHQDTDMPSEGDNAPTTTALPRPYATRPDASKEDCSTRTLSGLTEAAMAVNMAVKSTATLKYTKPAKFPRAARNDSGGHRGRTRSPGARSAMTTRQLTKEREAHPRRQYANARNLFRGRTVATKGTAQSRKTPDPLAPRIQMRERREDLSLIFHMEANRKVVHPGP